MPAVSVMFKPSSAACNLACEYCFYHSLANQRESYSHGFMSIETFENAVSKIFAYADGAPVYLSFQGGEPLLSGIEFFEKAFEAVKRENIKNSALSLCVQTNGVLINDDFARLFREYRVLTGVSLDGMEDQNSYRVDKQGKPTYIKVLDALDTLSYMKADFNILSVVSDRSAGKTGDIIDFFVSRGYRFLQFIPCLKALGEKENRFLSAENYELFLKESFAKYTQYLAQGRYVSIRHLDNMVRLVSGAPAEQCGMNGKCSAQMVVEGDGSVYPCDFYCLDENLAGNINMDSIDSIFSAIQKFDNYQMREKCKSCVAYPLCRGGCKREQSEARCKAYRAFAPAALPVLKKIGKTYL